MSDMDKSSISKDRKYIPPVVGGRSDDIAEVWIKERVKNWV